MQQANPLGRPVDVQVGWENGRLRMPGEAEMAALEARARQIRRHIFQTLHTAQMGHCGGSLSATEILVALYFWTLRVDPLNPRGLDRDRFVLSKGHATTGLYAALAERGYFPTELLATFDKIGSIMQGHPDRKKTPGIEISAGPLGMGLSVATGMALGARLDGRKCRIYALLSDGENQAGMTWEAAMLAGVRRLGNLTAFVDYNKMGLSDFITNLVDVAPLPDKWRAFNWNVLEIDGHDLKAVIGAIIQASEHTAGPTVVIAHTVKGKGVSFTENVPKWHAGAPTDAELATALSELADPEVMA